MDLSVTATYKNGDKQTFPSIEEAAIATGLTEASIKSRCSSGAGAKSKDGITFIWANEHTRRSKLAKKSKNKGNNFETKIVNDLKEIGYEGCVTSRSQSKRMDDAKIDIIDLNNELPVYIQSKYLANTPSYFNIENECPLKDKPFTVVWKKSNNCGENSEGTIAMIPYEFFLELLKVYKNK